MLYAGSNPVLRRMATNRSSILMVLNPVPAMLGSCCKIRSDIVKSSKRLQTLGNVSIFYAALAQLVERLIAIQKIAGPNPVRRSKYSTYKTLAREWQVSTNSSLIIL